MLRQNPLQIRIVCCTSGNYCNNNNGSSSREDCKWVTFAKSLRRQRGVCVILIDVQLMCSRKQILRRVFGRRCHLCGLRYNSERLGVRGARTHMQRSYTTHAYTSMRLDTQAETRFVRAPKLSSYCLSNWPIIDTCLKAEKELLLIISFLKLINRCF